MKKIILSCFIIFSFFGQYKAFAGDLTIGLQNTNIGDTKFVSINAKSGDIETQLDSSAKNILKTFKIIIGRLIVAYIVYAGVMMVLAMGDDEEKLSSAKRSIWYAIIALIFINIPGTLYNALSGKQTTDDVTGPTGNMASIYDRNIFMNSQIFGDIIGSIITFMEITVVALAVIVFIYEGVKLMFAHGDEEQASETKNKIFYSILRLIFVGVMETWRNIMYRGDFTTSGRTAFGQLANLALFFARPVAVFFVALAGYYYITAGGDEDKVNKAKSIIISTLIAVAILIGIYTILLDLKSLNF